MGFLSSIFFSLIGTGYTLLGTPCAGVYTRIPFESLKQVCATNWPRTQLDRDLCKEVEWGPRTEWPGYTSNHFEVTYKLCDCRSGSKSWWWFWRQDKLSASFDEAYFANGTTWKSVMIRGPWQSVEKSLECLMNSTEIVPLIEKIDIDIYGGSEGYELMFMQDYGVALPQPKDVLSGTQTLLRALSRLANLQVLRINIPTNSATEYDQVMKNTTVDPPIQATQVALGALSESILQHTPKVNDVSIYGWQFRNNNEAQKRVMQAIMGMELEHVELCSEHDLVNNIEVLRNGMPSLKRLSLRHSWDMRNITAYISPLKNFTRLVEVNLPGASDLDEDFNPPWCGNVYIDNPGYIDVVNAEEKESKKKLLGIVQEHLPFLQRVSFGGGEHYNLTRNDTSMTT
ncbi:hypothetical protein CPB86DRAFT_790526 [Serendipita vermifera]|nr:hypothetical protein CPB86DRAFT_790526 [Serendipita vermifera]